MNEIIHKIAPNTFEGQNHWYPKAFNATIHPMVNFFLNLDKKRVIKRYCHLHPKVHMQKLEEIMSYKCKYFLWCGADLINATAANGFRKIVVIENNSCPSGQKSMPLLDDNKEDGSYRLLVERTFKPYIKSKKGHAKVKGKLAVFYDKNLMETSGYAHVIADVFKEDCYLIPFFEDEKNEHIKTIDNQLHFLDSTNTWQPLRAVFRYVTQRPWNRIPIHSKTKILNPIVACLAGGRNKMVAAKAYELYNAELQSYGLQINIPETIWDVSKNEIPLWVAKMGGHAVIKIPYSNAGQGVFTITNQNELDAFMKKDFPYDLFIVQSLIGNYNWSSVSAKGKFYHVGTIPNNKGESYVSDIRMMVSSTEDGIKPLCVYARRANKPLIDHLTEGTDSWQILGTNLSLKNANDEWISDANRLMLMDRRDFNKLGIGLDDLIESYIQTILSMIAIDKMCIKLHNSKSKFRMRLFKSLNDDASLINEILQSDEKI